MRSDQAISQTLKTLGDSSVRSAALIDAPSDGGYSGQWISVSIDSEHADGVKERWVTRLIQGAVADLMRTNETTTSEVLSGAQLVVRDSSGNQTVTNLGHGGVVGGQEFQSPSDDELRKHVTDVATQYGLEPVSIEILHPQDSALAVSLQVPDGQVDWTVTELEDAIYGRTPNVEGLYLELDSPSGKPLFEHGLDFRVAGGSGWAAPGQEERFGIVTG